MGVAPAKPSKGILTKKIGPLPTWGWMAVGLGVAVIIASINSNKKKSAEEAAAKGNAGDYGAGYGGGTYGSDYGYGASGPILIGGSQRPPVIFQSYTTLPPMGGRPFPPCAPETPAPCPPSAGRWVTVPGRRGPQGSHGNPLATLAKELFGSADLWRSIWEAPENQALRARRKAPMMLQCGDRVWVPNLNSAGVPCPPDPACPPPPICGPTGGPPPCPPPTRPNPMPLPPVPHGPAGFPMPGRSGGRRHRR